MNPAKAYRTIVVPLSAFLVLGGIILAVCFWVVHVPITWPFPFVQGATLNRHLFGIVSLACVAIGIGLLFRNRVAWYALLVYLSVGVLLPVVSTLDTRTIASRGSAFPILGSFLNGAIAAGIYFAVRPAFAHANDQRGPDKAVNTSVKSGGN